MPEWEVVPFSADEFRRLLTLGAHAAPKGIASKTQTTYFAAYLADIGAQTIVAERGYIDRDFLEDFAAYYVRCHEAYERVCVRLHFFSETFAESDFDALLTGTPGAIMLSALQEAYLGFIVVKPLPATIFGRTCLATYKQENRRHFPITRLYQTNLFGFPLSVTSLAFQEQDQAAAACATSALWSAFQGTGILFQHHIPSPVQITRGAAEHTLFGDRALPSAGLTGLQMAHAVRQVGLEPTLLGSLTDHELWKANAYAYVKGRIPVMVAGPLVDHANPASPHTLGRHAIVLAGYSLGGPLARGGTPIPLLLAASRIDKFYAHDDQIGAFARMPCTVVRTPFSLDTSWTGAGGAATVRLEPDTILVPLYHKIRAPFAYVRRELLHLEAIFQVLRTNLPQGTVPEIEWDVYLTYQNDLKVEIATSALAGALRKDLLVRRMPKFIWRARGLVNGAAALDLLFDATGIESGNCCFRAIEWTSQVGDLLRAVAAAPGVRPQLEAEACWRTMSRVVEPS